MMFCVFRSTKKRSQHKSTRRAKNAHSGHLECTNMLTKLLVVLIVVGLQQCTPWRVKPRHLSQIHLFNNRGVQSTSAIIPATSLLHSNTTMKSNTEMTRKTKLLYLPGLDGGSGNFSETALGCLANEFACERLAVGADDRSTFLELTTLVIEHVSAINESVVLVGESFGAVLALFVAATMNPQKIAFVVLVNPGTSYEKTLWPTIGPMIYRSGENYPWMSVGALLATGVQPYQIMRYAGRLMRQLNPSNTLTHELRSLVDKIKQISTLLPPATLQWRLREWLGVGGHLLDTPKYFNVTNPTLILVGEEDRMLPSGDEGRRLMKLLKNAVKVQLKTYPGRGHSMLDGSIDMLQAIQNFTASSGSNMAATSKGTSGAFTYTAVYPTEEDIQKADLLVSALRRSTSPVFLSRSATGQLQRGLHNVPTGLQGRPVVLVSNHQLLGQDLPLVISEFLQQKNALPRGLAHPLIFRSNSRNNNRPSAMQELFTTFGAVEISPMAYYQLLKANATILLYPGGAKEAFHKRNDKYKLFWPERTDFVRMAATMDALIVPFASVGMDDSLFVIADEDDYERVPGVAALGRRLAARLPQARAGVVDTTLPPFIVPTLPARNYFLFQQAFDTRSISANNKAECRVAYKHVEGSLAAAIDTLLILREGDPYRHFSRRLIYETLKNKQAPFHVG